VGSNRAASVQIWLLEELTELTVCEVILRPAYRALQSRRSPSRVTAYRPKISVEHSCVCRRRPYLMSPGLLQPHAFTRSRDAPFFASRSREMMSSGVDAATLHVWRLAGKEVLVFLDQSGTLAPSANALAGVEYARRRCRSDGNHARCCTIEGRIEATVGETVPDGMSTIATPAATM
jgi:hypothetical protein